MKFPHNISRIEAFSDAVFAFAATLLVVSLGADSQDSVLNLDIKAFLSFGVCFFVLVGLWFVHYNFFRRNQYVDSLMIGINSVLLFVILYYVFPLKSLINSWVGFNRLSMDDFSNLFQLYSLGFFLIFLCFSSMYYRAYLKTKNTNYNSDLLFYARHFAIYFFVALVSIFIARLQLGLKIALPGMVYALLGPLCYWHGVWFAKKYKNN